MTITITHGYRENMGSGAVFEGSVTISESLWAVLDDSEKQVIVNKCANISRPAYADSWAYVK